MAEHRPRPRRPLDCRERRQGPAARGVLRRRRRRALEDHRRRRRPGRRSPTARSRARPSAPSPCPSRTPTSSTSAWARRAFAATSWRATASTNRPTPERRGRTSDSTEARRDLRRSASIPTNPDIVLVAAFGSTARLTTSAASSRATDGGKTWRKVLYRDDKTGAIDISIDRTNPNVIYAALWEAYRIEYQMSSGGPGSGLFKSTDGGETWQEITRNPGCRRRRRQDRRRRVAARTRTASTRSSRTRTAACSAPTTPAPRGQLVNDEPQHPPARLLLHAHHRRPEEQGRRLCAEHVAVPVDRRRQDPHERRQRHARRPPRSLDRSRRPEHLVNGNDGGGAISINGGDSAWTRRRISRRRSSITSSPRSTCRITCAARSRTTARRACRAPLPAASAAEAAAGNPLYSRRRRRAGLHRGGSEGPRRVLRRHEQRRRSSRGSTDARASCAR